MIQEWGGIRLGLLRSALTPSEGVRQAHCVASAGDGYAGTQESATPRVRKPPGAALWHANRSVGLPVQQALFSCRISAENEYRHCAARTPDGRKWYSGRCGGG